MQQYAVQRFHTHTKEITGGKIPTFNVESLSIILRFWLFCIDLRDKNIKHTGVTGVFVIICLFVFVYLFQWQVG